MQEYRPRLTQEEYELIKSIREKNDATNVMVVSDLHEPFCRNDYLPWIVEQYERWNCNKVVFIGDVVDNNYASFHTEDPDGLGGGCELDLSVEKIQQWYKHFPEATVTIGNHDRIISRKAVESKIPAKWIKEYKEVLGTPGWEFTEEKMIGDIRFIHGDGGKAHIRATHNRVSTVQGHWHSESYVTWLPSDKDRVFALQVGCGVDQKSYAMAYAKFFPKRFIIGCGIILDAKSGNPVPINLTMNLV